MTNWKPDSDVLNGLYKSNVREQEAQAEREAVRGPDWNINKDPRLASLFPSMLTEEEKLEMANQKKKILAIRKAQYEKGLAPVSSIMYDSMACNVSVEEVETAIKEEENRIALEEYHKNDVLWQSINHNITEADLERAKKEREAE